jgi:hypothetical protein
MKLWVSAEQEAVLADALPMLPLYPDSPYKVVGDVPSVKLARLDYNYVTVADASLYDGPGATAPPGNILAIVGPVHDDHTNDAREQLVGLLRKLGHEVVNPY